MFVFIISKNFELCCVKNMAKEHRALQLQITNTEKSTL